MLNADQDEQLIERALRAAGQTRLVQVARDLRHQAGPAFQSLFGQRPATIVADANTFAAAGRDVFDSFRRAGQPCLAPWIFNETDLHAEIGHVETIERALGSSDALAVAVGSGTINDLVKLASARLGRPYLVVATAASMDGYSAFGASITSEGSKQTFDCPAPAGILADLAVIESAPEGMNAWGYADLLAKSVAGADWILADGLGVEPIDAAAWEMMHGRLRAWLDDPAGIRRGDCRAVRCLILGLVTSGLAMQWTRTSRPASGADHQFSHLWDMQRHIHEGKAPSHGFKVGIGTLASSALYEQILPMPLDELDIDDLASAWPEFPLVEADIRRRFDLPELAATALRETGAKHPSAESLRQQLLRLQAVWPPLRDRLAAHLMPYEELEDRLAAAGCASAPEQIGISRPRLRESYLQAYFIRRRFTVLDLAVRTGLLVPSLERIFGPGGRWPIEDASPQVGGGGHSCRSN